MTLALSRYLGSKTWLVRSYPHLIPEPSRGRRAYDCTAGACSIPLHWLARGHRVVIGDANPRLIGTLRNLQKKPDDVVRILAALATDYADAADPREDFYTRRAHLNRLDPEALEASALFLFMLRAGFNGLWRENGKGECNTPWGDPLALGPGSTKKFGARNRDLVRGDELRTIAALLKRAEIRLGDFEATSADIGAGCALLADPPYVDRSAFVGYSRRGFTLKDRLRLTAWLRALDKRGVRWTLTDVATPESMAAHGLWNVDILTVRRSVAANGTREPAKEAIVRNFWATKEQAA